jgi:hypothetical protein
MKERGIGDPDYPWMCYVSPLSLARPKPTARVIFLSYVCGIQYSVHLRQDFGMKSRSSPNAQVSAQTTTISWKLPIVLRLLFSLKNAHLHMPDGAHLSTRQRLPENRLDASLVLA